MKTEPARLIPNRVSARRLMFGTLALAVLAACGHVTDYPEQAPPTTVPSSTTTSFLASPPGPTGPSSESASTTAAATGCLGLLAKAARLNQDFRATMTGIRGPTPEEEAKLRARGQALVVEARRLGCRLPAGLPT